jgi:hypothetical protein
MSDETKEREPEVLTKLNKVWNECIERCLIGIEFQHCFRFLTTAKILATLLKIYLVQGKTVADIMRRNVRGYITSFLREINRVYKYVDIDFKTLFNNLKSEGFLLNIEYDPRYEFFIRKERVAFLLALQQKEDLSQTGMIVDDSFRSKTKILGLVNYLGDSKALDGLKMKQKEAFSDLPEYMSKLVLEYHSPIEEEMMKLLKKSLQHHDEKCFCTSWKNIIIDEMFTPKELASMAIAGFKKGTFYKFGNFTSMVVEYYILSLNVFGTTRMSNKNFTVLEPRLRDDQDYRCVNKMRLKPDCVKHFRPKPEESCCTIS